MIAFSKRAKSIITTLGTPQRIRLEYDEPGRFYGINFMESWFNLCYFGSFKFYCEQDVDPFDSANRVICDYACVNKIKKGHLFIGGDLDGMIIETEQDQYNNKYVRHTYYVGSGSISIYGLKYISKDHVTKPLEEIYT